METLTSKIKNDMNWKIIIQPTSRPPICEIVLLIAINTF